MATEHRETLNAVFIGHVDSGKSTTLSHLMYQCGAYDDRTLAKLKEIAKKLNKEDTAFSVFLDKGKESQARGITIDTCMKELHLGKYNINVIDAPGHKDFIKNMVGGAAQADVACVLVPASTSEFESAYAHGTLKDHILIAGVLGCKKAIVLVNKLDTIKDAAKQEERFTEIACNMYDHFQKNHPDKDPIILPISGYKGINLTNKALGFSWFKGWKPGINATLYGGKATTKKKSSKKSSKKGDKVKKSDKAEKDAKNEAVKVEDTSFEPIRTLEEAINYQEPPKRRLDCELRFPIHDRYQIKGVGVVYSGRVESGSMSVNEQVKILPEGIETEIKTLEIHKKSIPKVFAGENCGLAMKLKGDQTNIVTKGHVICDTKDPLEPAYGIVARLLILNARGEIKKGFSPVMDLMTSHVATNVAKIYCKWRGNESKDTQHQIEPDTISRLDAARVLLIPTKKITAEIAKKNEVLAKFCFRDQGSVVAIGNVEAVINSKQKVEEMMNVDMTFFQEDLLK